ncbi:MAG: hypothetical protein WB791_10720 [Waddliaceae bacterium]
MKDSRHHRKFVQKKVIKSVKKSPSTPREVLRKEERFIPFPRRPKTILNKRRAS